MTRRATQERTLGAILGLAIGDALGMPATGLTSDQVQRTFGRIAGYHGRVFDDGAELAPGEFTDETEIALCIMETYTSTNGVLDPELIRARMRFLAGGESRRWMRAETVRSLEDETEPWYRSDRNDDPEVPLRGVPIGIIHATPTIDRAALAADTCQVVSLTHSNPAAIQQAVLVANAVAMILGGSVEPQSLIAALLNQCADSTIADALEAALTSGSDAVNSNQPAALSITQNPAVDAIVTGLSVFARAERFEDAVFAAVALGGVADSRGAFAGALAGAHFGSGGIPQSLIDGLEGRIYLTLAAPWFYRTVQLMTGRGIAVSSNGH